MHRNEKLGQSEETQNTETAGWFSERSYSQITQEKVTLARNMCLGSAGLSVLAIFRLSMASELSIALNIALYAFTIATPLFVALAFWYETFVWLGEESYDYLSSKRGQIDRWSLVPMLALYVGILAIVWHLSVVAGGIFIVCSVLALILLERNVARMREVLHGEKNVYSDDENT